MYPFLRLGWQMLRARSAPAMGVLDVHVSHHLCLPWDLDGFMELNNGRTLTLYDLGRFAAGSRIGLLRALRQRRWGLAVAGASIRYRKRVTMFQRIEMRTRIVGWDARFFYILQSMWVNGDCCSQVLLRTAVVTRGRSVSSAEVAAELGADPASPDLPDWVAGWIAAEGTRPWPPEDGVSQAHIPPLGYPALSRALPGSVAGFAAAERHPCLVAGGRPDRSSHSAAGPIPAVTRPPPACCVRRVSLAMSPPNSRGGSMTQTEDRRRVRGWMMFDWASQPFYTLCLTFIFGPYLTGVLADAWLEGAGEAAADAQAQQVWSWTQTGIGVAIALTAPILGAFADWSGRRMRWIWLFSALYVLGAAGLWWMMPDGSGLLLALAAFALAMVGAEFATVFTNAMLPDLADRAGIGRISGWAYALGYAGGVTALFLMLGLFADGPEGTTLLGAAPAFGLDGAAREGTRFVGPFTALWYAVFMVPFFLWVRDPAPEAASVRTTLRQASQDVVAMLRTLPGRPSLAAWLAGSMLYRDALVALYAFGGVYARLVLGWETTQIGIFGILSAITAAVASWIGGTLDARHGPKPVITACVWVLAGVVVALCTMSRDMVFGLPVGPDSLAPDVLFYVLGCAIGGAGGVLQASSRTMMVRHTDPARPTEAFGLYALSGKATAFLAPLSIGLATWATGSARLGIFPVALLFIAGLILLRWVDPEGDR